MLDRPITEADVGKLFRTRGGGTARVVASRESIDLPWAVEYEGPRVMFPTVTKNGFWSADEIPKPYDLISRIEEEPMSQVVVEDKRGESRNEAIWHSFGSYNDGRILQQCGGEVYLKIGDGRALQLTGREAGEFHDMNAGARFRHLTHLRLRMILEDA